eukprot:Plantae.Rhodophyta-Hildenbrandia_rubra.ctg1014.p2 GENE.Plantae.Rhodophyta-Hildenbrandia_rubra.ctg1014~~Plantae.Rhodophyta-Hildenbrandia_rubra.ctg1014.p2  ORF type:complete len:526 (+),score=94.45 Plantae.Rhodophyta-Hildenbrandia_rubra.ctg1014:1140-2717(+)
MDQRSAIAFDISTHSDASFHHANRTTAQKTQMSFTKAPPFWIKSRDPTKLYELTETFSTKLDNVFYNLRQTFPSHLIPLTFLLLTTLTLTTIFYPVPQPWSTINKSNEQWSPKAKMLVSRLQVVDEQYRKLARLYMAPFLKSGIKKSDYVSAMERGDGFCDGCFMVQIKRGQVWVWDPKGVRNTMAEFRELRMREALAWIKSVVGDVGGDDGLVDDTEFVVSTMDSLVSTSREHEWTLGKVEKRALPVFSIVRCNVSDNIPFPMVFTDMMRRAFPEQFWNRRAAVLEQWDKVALEYAKSSMEVSWNRKIGKAAFRGRIRVSAFIKDGDVFDEMCNVTGRSALWQIAHPDDGNIRKKDLENGRELGAEDLLDVQVQGTCGKRIYVSKQSRFNYQDDYKYSVYAEGNSFWADRIILQLFGSSAIIKQSTPCGQFFEPLLKPYVHYIPVDYFFRDLLRQTRWARENDQEVKKVVGNARQFAQDFLTIDSIKLYTKHILNEYTALLKDRDIQIHPGAFKLYPSSPDSSR